VGYSSCHTDSGYTKEMEEFLKTNPGLRSRVPNNFIFEDFTGDEIVQLGEMILNKGDYKLEDRDYYARHVKRAYDGSLDKSNGRWIRNLDEQLTKTMADRVVAQGSDDIETILNIDIDAVLNRVHHDYLYMCAKEDFSGTHNFARTYDEHMKNAEKYSKALNARGIK